MRTSTSLGMAAVVVLVILFGSFLVETGKEGDNVSFVILHSNDTHCYYGDDGNLGLSTLKSLEERYIASGDTVFAVDAGDFLQGNSYGTVTMGEASVTMMNTIGYDVGVPGNHDFDFTFSVLLERAADLNYPLICANLIYGSTGESVFPEYIVLEKGDVRLGFFGLLTPDTVTSTRDGNMEDAVVTDPVEASRDMVSLLSSMDVDYIVAIGHVGLLRSYSITSDEICSLVPGIDIFIDGHSHTEMEDGKVCDGSIDLIESDTLIASTGAYCHSFGEITVTDSGKMTAKLYRGEALPNPEVEAVLSDIEMKVQDLLSEHVAESQVTFSGDRELNRTRETPLANLVADSVRKYAGTDVAIVNGGSVRAGLVPGEITLKTIYDIVPFQNTVVTMNLKGQKLYDLMEYSYSHLGVMHGGFVQISGMTVHYDSTKDVSSRVVSIEIDGKEIDRDGDYSLATYDFVADGGDGNDTFLGIAQRLDGDSTTALKEYIKGLGTITEDSVDMGRQVDVAS